MHPTITKLPSDMHADDTTLDEDDSTPSTTGLLVAAWGMIDALDSAPERALEVIQTGLGRATVAVDESGVDVHLHDEGASVHVRPD